MEGRKTERVPVMFDPALLKSVDDYGFDNRIRSRAEAIRRLVIKGITETEKEEAGARRA